MSRKNIYSCFARYFLPVLPAASILAGAFLCDAVRHLVKGRARTVVAGAILLAAVAYNAPMLYDSTINFGLPFTQNIAREWIEKHQQ